MLMAVTVVEKYGERAPSLLQLVKDRAVGGRAGQGRSGGWGNARPLHL